MSLVRKLKDGSKEAYLEIYQQYFDHLYPLVHKHTYNEQRALLITENIFTKLWENRSILANDLDVEQYLLEAAKKALKSEYRRMLTEQKAFDFTLLEALKSEIPRDKAQPLNHLNLQAAFNAMPSQQKQVFKMAKLQGRTKEEIADSLSVSLSQIDKDLEAAVDFLQHKMEKA